MSHSDFQRRVDESAEAVWNALIEPQREFEGDTGANMAARRSEAVAESARREGLYEGLSDEAVGVVANVHANCIREHAKEHGIPDNFALAAMAQSVENTIAFRYKEMDGYRDAQKGVYESGDLSPSDGITILQRQVALVMPVFLRTITQAMTTAIPGHVNEALIYRITRKTASKFGDYEANTPITPATFSGQYTEMDQRFAPGTPDGTETGAAPTANFFQITAATILGQTCPIRKKYVKILYEGMIVAGDNGEGQIYGTFKNGVGADVSVTGTADYVDGIVTPLFSVAPEAGSTVYVSVEWDLERKPSITPLIAHEQEERRVRPHVSAIGADATMFSYYMLERELSLNLRNLNTSGAINTLAASKDQKILGDLRMIAAFSGYGTFDWYFEPPASGFAPKIPADYYVAVKELLMEINAQISKNTPDGVGLSGLVVPTFASLKLMAMPGNENFAPAVSIANSQMHPFYAGKLFGRWDLYVDPLAPDDRKCLCYAKGTSPGMCGYLSSIAISPVTVNHPVTRAEMANSFTIWGLDYRDINPWPDAKKYFAEIELKDR